MGMDDVDASLLPIECLPLKLNDILTLLDCNWSTPMFRTFVAALGVALMVCSVSKADLAFDQNITPDVIFGSGNANGFWTVGQNNGIELGLRAKLRFNSSNMPENTFNSNGDGTYTFEAGQPPSGFGFQPNSPSTAVWNFEWSINTNYQGNNPGFELDDLTYVLDIDFDPSAGVHYLSFDPINIPSPDFGDHAMGDNATGNGGGTVAASRAEYELLLATKNVAQNSWNMEFFDDAGSGFPFDANSVGEYTFRLTAYAGATMLSQTQMTVNVVPEPGTMGLLAATGVVGLVWRRRRR